MARNKHQRKKKKKKKRFLCWTSGSGDGDSSGKDLDSAPKPSTDQAVRAHSPGCPATLCLLPPTSGAQGANPGCFQLPSSWHRAEERHKCFPKPLLQGQARVHGVQSSVCSCILGIQLHPAPAVSPGPRSRCCLQPVLLALSPLAHRETALAPFPQQLVATFSFLWRKRCG